MGVFSYSIFLSCVFTFCWPRKGGKEHTPRRFSLPLFFGGLLRDTRSESPRFFVFYGYYSTLSALALDDSPSSSPLTAAELRSFPKHTERMSCALFPLKQPSRKVRLLVDGQVEDRAFRLFCLSFFPLKDTMSHHDGRVISLFLRSADEGT